MGDFHTKWAEEAYEREAIRAWEAKTMTPRGGAREGAGRPPRQEPKTLPIWCGQMAEQDRALIIEMLTPAERYTALMDAVAVKGYMMEGEDDEVGSQDQARR